MLGDVGDGALADRVADAGGPALRQLIPCGERGCVGAVLELALVREPVARVEDQRGHEQEDRDHHRGQDDHLAALVAEAGAHEQAPYGAPAAYVVGAVPAPAKRSMRIVELPRIVIGAMSRSGTK